MSQQGLWGNTQQRTQVTMILFLKEETLSRLSPQMMFSNLHANPS